MCHETGTACGMMPPVQISTLFCGDPSWQKVSLIVSVMLFFKQFNSSEAMFAWDVDSQPAMPGGVAAGMEG